MMATARLSFVWVAFREHLDRFGTTQGRLFATDVEKYPATVDNLVDKNLLSDKPNDQIGGQPSAHAILTQVSSCSWWS